MPAPTQKEFREAVQEGNVFRVRQLLEGNPGLAQTAWEHGVTPLHTAAEQDDVQMAHLLLAAGADMAARADWGHTPLAWAANCGGRDVGEMLMAAGAEEMNLFIAAGLGRLDLVASFWEDDGSLTPDAGHTRPVSREDGSWTESEPVTDYGELVSEALYIAGRNGHGDVVRFLLGKGAEIDHRGHFGGAALHWAAINGHRDTVELLLGQGADPLLRDRRFEATPADWADEGGHPEIAEVIRFQAGLPPRDGAPDPGRTSRPH